MILGNDALVGARPCTPAQVANACIAAGFDLVVPPTWGDELVATAYLERLAGRHEPVIVACACPRVAALVADAGTNLPQVTLAAPPVAAARALRAVHGEAILITYVGGCPSANDAAIDVRFSPSAFFAQLGRQEVSIADQPTAFGGAREDWWCRYASVPGGVPALRFLARSPVDRVLRTIDAASLARGKMTPSRSHVLVDLASAAECACGGARDAIEEGEPRRSTTPVVQCPPGLPLDAEPSHPRRRAVSLRGPIRSVGSAAADATTSAPDERPLASNAESPLVASAATVRTVMPDVDDSKRLDGASHTSGVSRDDALHVGRGPAPRPAIGGAIDAPASMPRGRVLALTPAIVLALAGALGAGVYAAGTSGAGPAARRAPATPRPAATSSSAISRPEATMPVPPASSASAPDRGALAPGQTDADSATRAAADTIARHDSVRAAARRRVRRAPAPDVVPGWMPQGRPAFVPRDSGAAPAASGANAAGRDSTSPAAARPDSIPPPA
ncbi:MAG TPA: hypothetical protein VFZ21_19885 [Gemmatimonadaceae bacterium]|nr:hypothetical protein [Gemmatimonadaceae bacterium]